MGAPRDDRKAARPSAFASPSQPLTTDRASSTPSLSGEENSWAEATPPSSLRTLARVCACALRVSLSALVSSTWQFRPRVKAKPTMVLS